MYKASRGFFVSLGNLGFIWSYKFSSSVSPVLRSDSNEVNASTKHQNVSTEKNQALNCPSHSYNLEVLQIE